MSNSEQKPVPEPRVVYFLALLLAFEGYYLNTKIHVSGDLSRKLRFSLPKLGNVRLQKRQIESELKVRQKNAFLPD